MSNRDELKDLQQRLAERLQTAKTQGYSESWLAVRSGGRHYLFPLAQAGEIFPAPPVQPIAHTRPWFLGVVNLRGGLFGLVDLTAFLAAFALTDVPSQAGPQESVVISFNAALEMNVALRVDALAGLRHRQAFVDVLPPVADAPEFLGSRYTDEQGQNWQEVNLLALSQSDTLLNISA